MINGIVTGHGEFSLGMLQALEMIAGEQEKMEAVPFYNDDSMEGFQEKLTKAISDLSDTGKVIIFTDLKGGTPFNVSMLVANHLENVEIVSGTNLPILLEFVVQRWSEESIETVLNHLIQTAQEGVSVGKIEAQEKEIDEDGI